MEKASKSIHFEGKKYIILNSVNYHGREYIFVVNPDDYKEMKILLCSDELEEVKNVDLIRNILLDMK